jgi:heterodisulfide reductase subunit A-like polyferredoxin
MMHSIWTFMTPFTAGLCNCDMASGCMAMRAAVEFEIPNMFKGEYTASVDWDACTGCRACVDLCPFGTIEHDRQNRRVTIDPAACWGCGTCRAACEEDAISLGLRAQAPA